jgi:hypothetical protein
MAFLRKPGRGRKAATIALSFATFFFGAGCSLLVDTGGLDTAGPVLDSSLQDGAQPDGTIDSAALDGDSGSSDASVDSFSAVDAHGDAPPPPSYVAQVMAGSPLLYLRFGETAGVTAKDETGHFNGTYSDAGIVYGAVGAIAGDPNTAVTLNGDPLVGIAMPPGLDFPTTTPFTLEIWVKQTKGEGFAWVLDHDDYDERRAGWDLLFGGPDAGAGPSLERWNDAGTTAGADVTYGTPLSDGTYHYVVATSSGTQLALYVDGTNHGLNGNVGSVPTTGVSWFIGNQGCSCSGNGIVGSIDELAIYGYALDAGTVQAHFAAAQ